MLRVMALCLGVVIGFAPLAAQADREPLKHSVYYQDLGFAMSGYDPVSFFYADAPQHGAVSYAVMWKGVTWLFSTPENQAMFEANPRAFAPQFGGYCAVGVSSGHLVSGDPESFEIIDGALYMLHSPEVQERWDQDHDFFLNRALGNWPDLLRE